MKFTDQTNRTIEFNSFPKRIISLVPSQTELLFDLGLEDEVIGITKFCIHPKKWFENKVRVGGTKKINLDTIKTLEPDLIIANKEENTKEEIEFLCSNYNVWISNIVSINDAFEMIHKIGAICNKKQEANALVEKIKLEIKSKPIQSNSSALYFIWHNPYMIAGTDTFINEMMKYAGLSNICQLKRYPEINIDEIKKLNPETILLSSEPFPFRQKHIDELLIHLPNCKIKIVDGEMFSWYGSRMIKAFEYFTQLEMDS